MIRSALRWLLSSIALLFVVTALTFVLVSLAPGDAARAILSGQSSTYTPEQYQAMRHALGIDQPLAGAVRPLARQPGARPPRHGPVQRAERRRSAAGPDRAEPVDHPRHRRASGLLGTWLGIVSARRGGVPGGSSTWSRWSGFAVPNFWLALLLVEFLAIRLAWFPPAATSRSPRIRPAGCGRSRCR
jgi:ABC-type dipeptide/oligopeptide/nickel transport systems, permease components